MPTLPRDPPIAGGSLELALQSLLPADATPWQVEVADVFGISLQPASVELSANTNGCLADNSNNHNETTTTNATCTVADVCPPAPFTMITSDICQASSTLNTPVLEVARLQWPSILSSTTNKSVLSPIRESTTISPLVSGTSSQGPFNLVSLEAGEPMKPSTLGTLDLAEIGFYSVECLRTVDPYSVTECVPSPPVVDEFDDIWSNFHLSKTIDDDDIFGDVDFEGILSYIESKEEPENITELTVPVVEAESSQDNKILAFTDHSITPHIQIEQAEPVPFTVMVKSEDLLSQVVLPQPGTSSDYSTPLMMPTTVEDVKIHLDEPIVMPKFNRKRKASELCVPVEELKSETELAPTILMLSEGRAKKTRGRPPVAKRNITTVPVLNTRQQQAPMDDSEYWTTSDCGNVSEADISDLKYRRMRDLNNEASKRCREKRKVKFHELVIERDIELEKNIELRNTLANMQQQVETLKEYFTTNCIAPNVAPALANVDWHQEGLSQEEFRQKYFKPKPE